MIKSKKILLDKLFESKRKEMIANFESNKNLIHPCAKGTCAENLWLKWFNDNFPNWYKAEKGFIIDCDGNISDEIDIVIYNSYYSPIIFNFKSTKYIPAESVYAVFEVKQSLNKTNIEYAINKIKSVKKIKTNIITNKYFKWFTTRKKTIWYNWWFVNL